MAMPQKPTPPRYCACCGRLMERKRMSNGELLSLLHFSRQKYCDRYCMAKDWMRRTQSTGNPSAARSMARRRKAAGQCERCGKENARDVHHKDGNPQNNDPENLERICRGCHNRHHRKRKACSVCGKPQKGLGFCDMHYQRFKKWGDPMMVKDNQHTPTRKVLGVSKGHQSEGSRPLS